MRVSADCPGLDVVAVGDLGGIEARAHQEWREVGDQIADGPELALEAVAFAEQHGERMPAAVAEGGKADGDHAARAGRRGERRAIGGRLEHRCRLVAAIEQSSADKIKQRHKEPP